MVRHWLSLLPLVSLGVRGEEECKPVLQIYQVQDASQTFGAKIKDMQTMIPQMITSLKAIYPDVEYGLATFTDKPIPFSGTGETWGGWGGHGYVSDVCYHLEQVATNDNGKIFKALANVVTSGGSDFLESQFEALFNVVLDPNAAWHGDRTDDDLSPVAKIAILITDSFPHLAGDAAAAYFKYNQNYGKNMNDAAFYFDPNSYQVWIENRMKLTIEPEEMERLEKIYGGVNLEQQVTVRPNDRFDETYYEGGLSCKDYEYIDTKNPGFGGLLKQKSVIPIFLVVGYTDEEACDIVYDCYYWRDEFIREYGPTFCPAAAVGPAIAFVSECTKEYYTLRLSELNVYGVVSVVKQNTTSEELVDVVSSSINIAVNDLFCKDPTTLAPTEAPTTTVTTTTTIVAPATTKEAVVLPIDVTLTKEAVVLPIDVTLTKEAIVLPIDVTLTKEAVVLPIDVTLTKEAVVLPIDVTLTKEAVVLPIDVTLTKEAVVLPIDVTLTKEAVVLPIDVTLTKEAVVLPIDVSIPDAQTPPPRPMPVIETTAVVIVVPPVDPSAVTTKVPSGPVTTSAAGPAVAGTTTPIAVVGGPNAVVIGAAAAGIAAAAAIAGVLYAKGVFAGFGSSSPPVTMENMEMPDVAPPRDVMMDVTADMFA